MILKDCPMKKKIAGFHLKASSKKPVCLVAGGAGFIGSYLCEQLLKKDCQVICLDNLSTGRKENLAGLSSHQNFTFINHDLTKPFKKQLPKIDYLFHLAGVEAYLEKKDLSLDLLKVNAAGTNNLLELARKDKAKFLLVSSIDVYSAALSISSLRDYYQGEESLLSHSEAKRFAESLVFEYFKKYRLDARIVRLGQVYGPRMNLKVGTRIVGLFREALSGGPMRLPGDGRTAAHPTFVLDVVEGLLRAMFFSGTNGRIFSLVDPKEVSFLAFSQELQKQSPASPSLEFIAPKEDEFPFEKEKLFVAQRYLSWTPKTDLSEGISQTLAYFHSLRDKEKKLQLPFGKKGLKKGLTKISGRSANRVALVFLIIFLFLAPLLFFIGDVFWGLARLNQAKGALERASFEKSAAYSVSARKSFAVAKTGLDWLDWLWRIGWLEAFGEFMEDNLSLGQNLAGAFYHASLAAQAGEKASAIIFQNQEGDLEKLTGQVETEIDFVYNQLSRLQIVLEKEQQDFPLGNILGLEEKKKALKLKIKPTRELALQLKKGIRLLPSITALSGKRTYLVLLQNNMELRPTGGFIGSFGLATFKEGRFIDFEVHNVYTADGQLKGHVEPPPEIKNYLGEAGWYLRDSNFDPDFPTSALRAEWFLEKEMGRVVDGVLAINLDFAQKILVATGEIDLPDYQEKITAANLFERAQYHAEIGFFSGSTQKEDFLGALARALYVRIRDSDQGERFSLGKASYQALKEKDLLIFLHEEEEAQILTSLDWDGSLKTMKCQPTLESCLTDYLMIVEANFGVNKANFFVKREITHQVKIADDGTIKENLQLVYFNQSPSENLPAGRYKNYLRLYTPAGTKLGEIKMDGQRIGEEKIKIEETDQKSVFGFLVEVPIKEKRKVEIAYQLGEKLDLTKPRPSYLFLVQRQSGSPKDVFNLWVSYPPGVFPEKTYPQTNPGAQTILFQPKLDQDFLMGIDFFSS